MGCDIHMWAEVYYNDSWLPVGHVFKNLFVREGTLAPISWYPGNDDEPEYVSDFNAPLTIHPYDERNYEVFGILAGVRSRDVVSISEPRGLPDDVTPYVKSKIDEYYHSVSWLSLKELEDYDWEQIVTHTGWVDLENYLVFKTEGQPNSWSDGVGGYSVKHISNEEADVLIKYKNFSREYHSHYTKVSWDKTYRESSYSFYTETIPALQNLRNYSGVHDIRVVFGFDS